MEKILQEKENYWRELAQRIQEGVREDLRRYFEGEPPDEAVKNVSATALDIVRKFGKDEKSPIL